MTSGESMNGEALSKEQRRQQKIAKRLARRAIKAASREETQLDVRGLLNLRRKYKNVPYNYGAPRPSARPIYHDAVYAKVNEILADEGLLIERRLGKISYYGVGCYVFGHNNETVKSYDQMLISRKRPPEHEDAGLVPTGPDDSLTLPDHVPLEWLNPQTPIVEPEAPRELSTIL